MIPGRYWTGSRDAIRKWRTRGVPKTQRAPRRAALSPLGRFRRYSATPTGRGEWLTAVVVTVAAALLRKCRLGARCGAGPSRVRPNMGRWRGGHQAVDFFSPAAGCSRSVHHIRLDRAAPRSRLPPPGPARSALSNSRAAHDAAPFSAFATGDATGRPPVPDAFPPVPDRVCRLRRCQARGYQPRRRPGRVEG
jgi:hypothetical protein